MSIDPGGTGIAGTLTCPRCTAPVPAGQDWCLRCGTAARTRLVPTPNWRLPLALAAVLALLALAVLAAAFVALTDDPGAAPSTTTPAPPAAAAPAP
jgi:ABC-type enterobactin transport system permease subunit